MGLRRLRTDRGVAVTVVLVALLLAGLLAALPRQLARTSEMALHDMLVQASTAQRGVLTTTSGDVGPARHGDPLAGVRDAGAQQVAAFPPPLRSVVGTTEVVVSTPQYDAIPLPGDTPGPPRHLTLRIQDGITDHARIVDGRWPQPTDATFLPPGAQDGPDPDDAPDEVPVREIAVNERTAAQLRVQVGDRIYAAVDPDDPLVRRGAFDAASHRSLFEVVGIVALDPLSDPFWFDDGSLFEAREVTSGLTTHVYATALLAPGVYPQLTRGRSVLYTQWRHLVPPDAVDPSRASQLAAAVHQADASYPDRANIAQAGSVGLRTGLGGILDGFFRQRQLAIRVLALVASGVLAVALAVLAMVGVMAARRRRDRVALVRSRGASGGQLVMAELAEALLLALPAGALGAVVAIVVIPAGAVTGPVVLSAVAGVLAAGMVVVAALGPIRAGLRTLLREDRTVARPSARRLVAEAALVAVSVIALVLLRRRGLSDTTGLDPLLVAVPPLLALAVAVVTVRLLPLPMRVAARLAARSRGAVGVLGLRRTAREPATVLLPLVVLVLALGIAAFASVLTTTVQHGQVLGAWQEVGADVLVSRPAEEPITGLEVADVRGVTTAAPAAQRLPIATLPDGTTGRVTLLAADAALTAVTADTPAAVTVPAGSDAPDGAVRALATRRGPHGRVLRPGDHLSVTVSNRPVDLVVTAVTDTVPSLDPDLPALVVDRDAMDAAVGRTLDPTRVYLRGDGRGDGIDLAAVHERAGAYSATVSSVSGRLEALRSSPLVTDTVAAFRVAMVVAGLLALLGVAAAVVLTARERERDLSFLSAVGCSRRQLRRLTAIELLPGAVAGVTVGILAGLATAWLVVPVLRLAPFTGPVLGLGVASDPAVLLGLAAGGLLAVALAIVLTTRTLHRRDLAQTLRMGAP